jgi:hypothetical protein
VGSLLVDTGGEAAVEAPVARASRRLLTLAYLAAGRRLEAEAVAKSAGPVFGNDP